MTVHEATPYVGDTTDPTRLLTVSDVAHRLAISRDSVYRFVRSGALSPLRVGERLRFRPEEIEEYLERNREAVR
jgi:excisionase family DNA binding protein